MSEPSIFEDLDIPEPLDRPGGPPVDQDRIRDLYEGRLSKGVAEAVAHNIHNYKAWRLASAEYWNDEAVTYKSKRQRNKALIRFCVVFFIVVALVLLIYLL